MSTLSLGTKAPKLVGKLSDKLEKLFDKQKGTSKKITAKEKKQLQKNIDANKGKVTQIKKRASNLKKKQTKPKQEVETSTKLAPKELQEKFKKQQENLKKLKENKTKTIKPKTTVKGKKVYDKPIGASPKKKTGFVLGAGKGKKVYDKPTGPLPKKESRALTVINKPKNKSKSFGGSGQKTKTDVKKLLSMKGSNVFSKAPSKTKTGNILSRNKKKLAALAVAGTIPFAIDTEDSKVKSKNKDIKKIQSLKKETAPKINKPKTSKVDVKKLEKKRTNITAGGNTGFGPKGNIFAKNEKDRKRLMDLYGGTGSAAYKAAVKGTQGNLKVAKKSTGGNLKSLPPKSENPGIHKLPPKVKMNMGFKPMFGGGLVASFYDKAEKGEKYKGNASVARQVRGFGKAKKKN